MKIKQVLESSAGATASGSVATVAMPMGKPQKRAGSLFKGKTTNKPFYEGDATDVEGLEPIKKVMKGKAKKKGPYANSIVENKISEAELSEQDLIINPGQLIKKDKSFIPHKADRRDHEVSMARSELLAAAKSAMRLYELLKDRSEDQGLMAWQQSYITLAADYLQTVANKVEYETRTDEMTGGVIAGGMSNFEEGMEESKHQWHGHNKDLEWYDSYKDAPLTVRIRKNPNGLSGPTGTFKIIHFFKDGTSKPVADLGIMYRGELGGYDINLDDPPNFLSFRAGSMPVTARQAFNLFQTKKQSVKEEKQRLDPKCWKGYKKQGTKMKGGVRVNNCVKK
jgi:hypothetical protein